METETEKKQGTGFLKGSVSFCKKIPLTVWLIALVLALIFIIYRMATSPNEKMTITTTGIGGAIHNIGELATSEYEYTMVQIANKPSKQVIGFNIPFTKSKVVYSYDGRIKAGVDFEEVSVQFNRVTKTFHVDIPEPKILSSEVFYDSLVVYDEDNSPFNAFTFEDMNLSISALQDAAEEKASSGELLYNAAENAKNLIATTIHSLYGSDEATIEFE